MPNIDSIIDRFAEALRNSGVNIVRVDAAPWFTEIEGRLSRKLPRSYESLARRYSFSAFDVQGVALFGSRGHRVDDDLLTHASPECGALQKVLRPAGFLQIGRPVSGDFDAICFDLNAHVSNREYPVVRIDHESALCKSRIRIVGRVWDSFFKMVERFLLPS